MSRSRVYLLAWGTPLLLAMTGCNALDPEGGARSGEWRPAGVNEANLRAMVAVPSDLVYGESTPFSDGNRAARAMDRLRTDHTYPLPDSAISKVGGSGSSAGAAPSTGAE